ncbi:MAG: hypothetical protein SGJ27_12735 [Candidatus Melainabacteria bacterium]|nr:hypothetical protein [Candidatus Melainabacteria bacterium]
MDDQELKQTLDRLEEQQRKIFEQLSDSNSQSRRRDFWDKLTAISPILSGVAIALSALLCTYQYNQQQIKLQEAQTVEKFIPHLMGNDTSKRMAILAMKTLVNTDLAAKYAAMFPSEGTLSALKTIAKNGDNQDRRIISKTYEQIEANTKGDSLKNDIDSKIDITFAENAPPSNSDQSSAIVVPAEADTAGDTAAAERSHVVPKEHGVGPAREHILGPQKEHAPAAEDKESREESLPRREVEARGQQQLERVRSSAMKEEPVQGM